MKKHNTVFSNAMLSKQDFWNVDSYKRAMVFVFMARYLFGMDGQKQWKAFSMRDYKFNVRLFRRWLECETDIFSMTSQYLDLPEKANPRKRRQIGRGRRKAGVRQLSSASASESPMKKQCVVQDDFTDDEFDCVGTGRGDEDEDEDEESGGGSESDDEDNSDDSNYGP